MASRSDSSLTLHYFPMSFYSQKAVVTLVEKNLPFKRKIVNLHAMECYTRSYMKINPQGQVPVLQDGSAYIPDSAEIAKYLDEKYEGNLLQPDVSTDLGGRVKHFHDLYDSIKVEIVTYGAAIHPEVVHEPKLLWIVTRKMKGVIEGGSMVKAMEKQLKKNPDLAEMYNKKIVIGEEFRREVLNKSRVVAERKKVREILHETEKELTKTAGEYPGQETWLCGPTFTIADICLTVLLARLDMTGYAGALFENGLLPNVEEYYVKVQKRTSFKDVYRTVSLCTAIKAVVRPWLPVAGVTGLVLLGVGVGYLVYRKQK